MGLDPAIGGGTATIRLTADGRYLDASPAALQILGVDRERFLTMSSTDFAVEPPDPEADSAFRTAWERSGRTPIYAVTSIRRADGGQVRVRFVIEPEPEGGYVATLQAIDEPVDSANRVFTLGDVLAEWRAAERRLAAVPPDTEEWRAILADVEALRTRYQQGFEARQRGPSA